MRPLSGKRSYCGMAQVLKSVSDARMLRVNNLTFAFSIFIVRYQLNIFSHTTLIGKLNGNMKLTGNTCRKKTNRIV